MTRKQWRAGTAGLLGGSASGSHRSASEGEAFVSYINSDPEYVQKIRAAERRVMAALGSDFDSCLDSFVIFVRLAAVMAKMGHLDDEQRKKNPRASQDKNGLSLEEFLQNCRRAYENCQLKVGIGEG